MEVRNPKVAKVERSNIDIYVDSLIEGGFEEITGNERDQLRYFWIPTPEDTRIFRM
ncbi:MAG: hypothetical protein [Bacteriophage sp.]|nr:MAG: hypothetical protein [Bacteriophage sp.]UVX69414.1 MAG: hypothetical protein [Bacteriophage sp.]